MQTVLTIVLFLLGLALIVKGGDWFVDSAVWMAEASGIPHFIIGATIVSIATTVPELMVSTIGTAAGEVDMAVGNAVGSVTANIGLIMGISLTCLPAVIQKKQFTLKGVLMLLASVLLYVLCVNGSLHILPSILLLVIFGIYVATNVKDAKKSMTVGNEEANKRVSLDKKELLKQLIKFIIGVVAIVVGSDLLIDYGSAIAEMLGVPSAIIGVTMVAIGTSLPELVTTITAITKKQASMSIGNIVGANVIDLTLILPICSLISGGNLTISRQSTLLDMPACCVVGLIAVIPAIIKGKFYRWQGVLLLAVYVAYLIILVVNFGV